MCKHDKRVHILRSEQVSTGPEFDGTVIAANPPTLMAECVPACISECISFTGLLGSNAVLTRFPPLPQVQTRSADEPMTTFVLCNDCGNRWKVRSLLIMLTQQLQHNMLLSRFNLIMNTDFDKGMKSHVDLYCYDTMWPQGGTLYL